MSPLKHISLDTSGDCCGGEQAGAGSCTVGSLFGPIHSATTGKVAGIAWPGEDQVLHGGVAEPPVESNEAARLGRGGAADQR